MQRISKPTLALTFAFALIVCPVVSRASAHLGPTCIADSVVNLDGINDARLVQLIEQIKRKFQDFNDYVTISCPFIDNVIAFEPGEGSSLPRKKFIIVNMVWFESMTRQSVAQQHFLLGHEIAHHVNGDLSSSADRRNKELRADAKGACAAAHLGASWDEIEDVLRGLRGDPGSERAVAYPSFPESREVALQAYRDCGPRNNGQIRDQDQTSVPDRSVFVVYDPKNLTVDAFNRAVDRINGAALEMASLPDMPSSIARYSFYAPKDPSSGNYLAPPNLGEIRQEWTGRPKHLMTFNDRSYEFDSDSPPIPVLTGIFFAGPATDGGNDATISLERASPFIEGTNPAFVNLIVTEGLVSVATGFAALKASLENNHPVGLVTRYAEFTDASLRDLRTQAAQVENFGDWTKDLTKVDELLQEATTYIREN